MISSRLKVLLLSLAAVGLVFTACSDDNGDDNTPPPPPAKNTLSIEPISQSIDYNQTESIIIEVETDADFFLAKAKEEYDWIAVIPNTDEGYFSVKPIQNDTEEERTAVVVVTAGNADPVEFTLTQGIYTAPLPPPPIDEEYYVRIKKPYGDDEYAELDYYSVLSWEFAGVYEGEMAFDTRMYVELVTDIPWKEYQDVKLSVVDVNYIAGGDGWFEGEFGYDHKVTEMSGKVLYTCEVMWLGVTQNSSPEDRICEVTIGATGVTNVETAKLRITQQGKPLLSGSWSMDYYNPAEGRNVNAPKVTFHSIGSGYDYNYTIHSFGGSSAQAFINKEEDGYWFKSFTNPSTIAINMYEGKDESGKDIYLFRTFVQKIILYLNDDLENAITLAQTDPALELKYDENTGKLYTEPTMIYEGTEYHVAIAIYGDLRASDRQQYPQLEGRKLLVAAEGIECTIQ